MRFVSLLCAALALTSGIAHAQTHPAAPAAPTAGQIDINSASRDELMTLDGIGEVRADAIIRSRPFKAKTDLVERRVIPEALYEKLADKVAARAVPTPPAPRPMPTAPAPRR
jgi:DNA uptake protein ComE-like DNA-binding protein